MEIQKIRQDKINPAYSPAQSEPGSPGKFNIDCKQCMKFSYGKFTKNTEGETRGKREREN